MNKYYRLEIPNLKKINDKRLMNLVSGSSELFSNSFRKSLDSPYLYWDKLRYTTLPKGISPEEHWLIVKIIRKGQSKKSPIVTPQEESFHYAKQYNLEKSLNLIDMKTGGSKLFESKGAEKKRSQIFVRRGILEEAIASSQLEGAHTTRKVAKKMILEGRKPKTKSEKMIVNNYNAIRAVEEEYKDRALDEGMLLELHDVITKDTLEDPKDEGRFRQSKDSVHVSDNITGVIYHEAPGMKFVRKEMRRLVDFANDELTNNFIHPVVKAIMLHFWIGYLHPFADGNGRIARLLFYWYLLRKGYWAFAYVPISKIIKRSPKQYGMAYIYTEQDGNDLTYFIDYNIRKIEKAVAEFEEYMNGKADENKEMNSEVKIKYRFNDRQIMLLQYFFGDEAGSTNISAHSELHQITKKTAIKDLIELRKQGFLKGAKRGRKLFYYPTDKINSLFVKKET